jgi:hypothetical protein
LKLPYILIADEDIDHRNSFATVFEKHVPYANISTIDDLFMLPGFLSEHVDEGLPDLILLNIDPSASGVPDLMRESLLHPLSRAIPKIVWIPGMNGGETLMNGGETLDVLLPGVTLFLKWETDLFDLENSVREVDALLRSRFF